jgi:hypothetical protein
LRHRQETFYDDVLLGFFMPEKHGLARLLGAGFLPTWLDNHYCGEPFIANLQHAVLYPGNLPFWLLPTSTALEVVVALHVALAGTGMWAYSPAGVADRALGGRHGRARLRLRRGHPASHQPAEPAPGDPLDLLGVRWFVTAGLPPDQIRVMERNGFRIVQREAWFPLWERWAPPLARMQYDVDVVPDAGERVARLRAGYPLLERAIVERPVGGWPARRRRRRSKSRSGSRPGCGSRSPPAPTGCWSSPTRGTRSGGSGSTGGPPSCSASTTPSGACASPPAATRSCSPRRTARCGWAWGWP